MGFYAEGVVGVPVLTYLAVTSAVSTLLIWGIVVNIKAGSEQRKVEPLVALQPMINTFPESWDTFVKPLIFNPNAFWNLQEVGKIWKMGGIKSYEDMALILWIIDNTGLYARKVLKDLIVAGIDEKVISLPLSNEDETLKAFITEVPYMIPALYQAYRENRDIEGSGSLKNILKASRFSFFQEGGISENYSVFSRTHANVVLPELPA